MLRIRMLPVLGVLLLASPRRRTRPECERPAPAPRRPRRVARRRCSAGARAARRRDLPSFLHDTGRNRDLQARGLLTNAAMRAARAAKAGNRTAGVVDTVRVLVARVGFEANREPSLTSGPPSGDFMLVPDSTVIVDPPPHDARYFDALLLAMRSFYDVRVRWSVGGRRDRLPPQDDATIQLSDLADYGPGRDGRWTIELLEAYFRDAIGLLDSTATERGLISRASTPTSSRIRAAICRTTSTATAPTISRPSSSRSPTRSWCRGTRKSAAAWCSPNLVAGRSHRRHVGRHDARVRLSTGVARLVRHLLWAPGGGRVESDGFRQCADDRLPGRRQRRGHRRLRHGADQSRV